MKVIKFGGTSLATPERMKQVAEIVAKENAIVVLSAISGTTNTLTEIAQLLYKKEHTEAKVIIQDLKVQYLAYIKGLLANKDQYSKAEEIIKHHFSHINSFTQDLFTIHEEKTILAQGELLSTALFQLYLEEVSIHSCLLPALEFMRIDKDLEPDTYYIKHNLERELKFCKASLYITQGYICRSVFGEIDNLKRGGSDYTAALIGEAIQASEIEIWTDIDGMHNNDPRIVDNTYSIEHLSYNEAAELAYFGAKILHPASIYPAKLSGIPIFLKNTMQPEQKGTKIEQTVGEREFTAVAAKDGITAIKIISGRMLLAYGFLRKIFDIFERYKTPIDVITTSEVAVSLTIDDNSNLEAIYEELKSLGEVSIQKELSIVCVVGNFSHESKGAGGKIFDSLEHIPIRMVSYGGSQHNVSIVIETKYKKEALVALNNGLFNQK
ncbi:aspartate kinase [Brumimicrobium salinarum]|uniref:Aspartokinase n=1 Tax=Brumimicrobium salinarum TaxID=2058658 RepID=A0A2I0R2E7_9FLAO|nr:aspartate kinase [Brumimicrobium salinarum]PKR80752.1 aspartate kinase [Brumimicrobium salinarum]